jgi:hypothetical protein
VDAIMSVVQSAAEEAQVERLCPLPVRLGVVGLTHRNCSLREC